MAIEKKSLWMDKDRRAGSRLIRVKDFLPNSQKPITVVAEVVSVDGVKPAKPRDTRIRFDRFEKQFERLALNRDNTKRIDPSDPLHVKIRKTIQFDKDKTYDCEDSLLEYAREHLVTLLDLADSFREMLGIEYARSGREYIDAEAALKKFGLLTDEMIAERRKKRFG